MFCFAMVHWWCQIGWDILFLTNSFRNQTVGSEKAKKQNTELTLLKALKRD